MKPLANPILSFSDPEEFKVLLGISFPAKLASSTPGSTVDGSEMRRSPVEVGS